MAPSSPSPLQLALIVAAILFPVGDVSAASLFDRDAYVRDLNVNWQTVDVDSSPAIMTAQRNAQPHWRDEFNPLGLAHTGGTGFTEPVLPVDQSANPPAPAALAMTGIGFAAFLGGRRKNKPARH